MAGWLGTMDAETLLRLAIAAGACAIILAGLLLVYVMAARRRARAKSIVQAGPPAVTNEDFDTASLIGNVAAVAGSVPTSSAVPFTVPPTSAVLSSREVPARPGRELLRVVYDAGDGHIWVTSGTARYRAFTDIQDPQTAQRVLAALTHALRFSGGLLTSDEGAVSLTLAACGSVPVPEPPPAEAPAETESGEWLRLIGDPEQARVWIEVAGKRYARLHEVADREIGLRILKGISYLVQFTGGLIATDSGVCRVPLPPLHTEAPPTLAFSPESNTRAEAQPNADLAKLQEAFLRQLLAQGTPDSGIPAKKGSESIPSFSLVDEIDRIFQSKLALSALAGTDAQLMAGRDGSVRVRVGSHYYESPDQVPDDELRNLIKAAIAEW